jgi:hypothetical protein
MTEILIGSNPNNPQIVGSYKSGATNEEKATQLPEPSGYHILCAIPESEKEFDNLECLCRTSSSVQGLPADFLPI